MSELGYNLLDIHFSKFLADRSGLSGADKDNFKQLVRALTTSQEAGHSCLPVSIEETRLLKRLHLVSDGGLTPLVLNRQRLYLHRNFSYESRLAMQISTMAALSYSQNEKETLFDNFFGNLQSGIDWQK